MKSRGAVRFSVPKKKIGLLYGVTSLVITLARNYASHARFWSSGSDFLMMWFIHFIGIGIVVICAGASIMSFDKFWLGYKIEEKGWNDRLEEITYYVLMTLLVISVIVIFGAHHIPNDYDD